MKRVQFVAMAGVIALLTACETIDQTAGMGYQEQKRMARAQREQQEYAQYDESDINLWNAHQDMLTKGTNPAISYTPLVYH